MASFMFHFGYAVRSEKYVVPRTTFVVASYEVRQQLRQLLVLYILHTAYRVPRSQQLSQ